MAYNFKNLADVELLSSMPETANVLVEVNGTTKRAPQVGGASTLDEMPGVILFAGDNSTGTFSCNKTFEEALNMIKNGELRLVLVYGMLEGYTTLSLQIALPRGNDGNAVFDDTATNIGFQTLQNDFRLYLLNDNTVTRTDPCANPPA